MLAQRGEVAPPRTIWPQVAPALEAACLKALAKEPTDRYQSAADLAQAVHTWQEVQRRQAEEALQRQTEILQSILNSMGEGVIVADEAGKLLLINAAAERILGPQPVGKVLQESRLRVELCLPDKVTPCPPEQRPLSRAVRGEIIDDVELYVRIPDKAEGIWMSASGRPLQDEQGKVKGGLVVVRDISERKRAEEELRRSRERFELAVRGSQDGLWDWDLQTDEVYYSPRWKSILGYEDHEIAHHINEWDVRLHPDERERVVAANLAHINGDTPYYEYEYRLRHKDGTYRWILARGVALRDANGKAYRMAGSHVDVTSRKEAERALKESEERYHRIIAVLQVGIVVVGADGLIQACNPSAERILGLAAGRMKGRSIRSADWKAIREDGTPFPAESFPAALTLASGRPTSNVVMGVPKPDGAVSWISINAQPLFAENQSTPYAVVTSFEDITAAKQTAAALEQTQAALARCRQDLAKQG
jgi:PAS domain S-box-containing protein